MFVGEEEGEHELKPNIILFDLINYSKSEFVLRKQTFYFILHDQHFWRIEKILFYDKTFL